MGFLLENMMELDQQQLDALAEYVDELLLNNSKKSELEDFFNVHLMSKFTFVDEFCEGYFYYILANCSSQLYTYNKDNWFSHNLVNTVNLYEKSLYFLKKTKRNNGLLSFVLTNLGNYLSSQGRLFCAQYYWDQAIKIDNNPVALIAKSQNLIFRATQLYDDSHTIIHYYFANQLINQAYKNIDFLEEEQKVPLLKGGRLYDFHKWYKQKIKDNDFLYLTEYKQKTKTKAEFRYLVWSAKNKLFLNDLNDLFDRDIVYQDILGLPNMIYKINLSISHKESLVYHSNFDELRNEYTYARFLMFQSFEINNESDHFYNQTYHHLNDTLHAIDNLKTSHMKSAFRILYSIFDKISYFLAKYLDLEIQDSQITFSKIFGKYNKKQFEPREELKNSENFFLHALFYILKEIEVDDRNKKINDELEQNIVDKFKNIEHIRLAKIRNHLEHRSFRIVDDFGYELNTKFNFASELAYQKIVERQSLLLEQGEIDSEEYQQILEDINEKEKKANYILEMPLSEFENALMNLARLVRNSLMYLSLAVHFEESNKPESDDLTLEREVPLR